MGERAEARVGEAWAEVMTAKEGAILVGKGRAAVAMVVVGRVGEGRSHSRAQAAGAVVEAKE